MSAAPIRRLHKGRPLGSKSSDPVVAYALGQAVLGVRVALNVSQESLALTSGIGRSNLSSIENGRSTPNFIALVKIAAALNCSVLSLVEQFELSYERAKKEGIPS